MVRNVSMAQRTVRDIPELVSSLEASRKLEKDFLKAQSQFHVESEGNPASKTGGVWMISGTEKLHIMEQAHDQIAGKLDIPRAYYHRMMDQFPGLLSVNINTWLQANPDARRLIRTWDGSVRAFLSDRYRPISHLDLVYTAVQVASGQEAQAVHQPWAKGARCFQWNLDPSKMDVHFVNPSMALDLKKETMDIEPTLNPDYTDLGGWLRGLNEGGDHKYVFPTARIRNSETGHGGLYVNIGLMEGACLNGMWFERDMAQVHLGKVLQEEEIWSADTMKKMNAVIFAKMRDVFRMAFEPHGFIAQARKFKGLEAIAVDPFQTVDTIVELNGLTDDIKADILAAYTAQTERRNNLHDVTRAVTYAAHTVREKDPDQATSLEQIGGRLVERGLKALVAA